MGCAKVHKKKMFIGGAMAVANLGLNAIAAIKANTDAREANNAVRGAMIRDEFAMDKEQLKSYNKTGNSVNMFAKGGRITTKSGLFGKAPNTPGGLAKVSGNIYKAVGEKHENGGTPPVINGKNIAPNVELDGGEYVKVGKNNIKVISDRDIEGTIPADEFEGKLGTKSADAAFDDEYSKQETAKRGKTGKAKMVRGGLANFTIDPTAGNNTKDTEALYGTIVSEATVMGVAGSPRLLPQVNAYGKRTYPSEENAKDIESLYQTVIPEATVYGNKSYPAGENSNDIAALTQPVPRPIVNGTTVKPLVKPIATTITKPITKPVIDMTAGNNPADVAALNQSVSKAPLGGAGVVDDAASIGAKFKLGDAGQYIDNVGNAILTLAKPKVPEPVYAKPVNLDTEVNVNPQLSEIQRTAANLRRGIRGNFANPVTASALEQKADTNALMQKNEMLGKKAEQETQLKNQETMINQRVSMQNQELANQHNMNVMGRTQEQFGELSANLGNIQDDITHKDNMGKLADYQDKQLYVELLTDVEGKNSNAVASGLFDSVLNKLSKADFDKLKLPARLKQSIDARLKK